MTQRQVDLAVDLCGLFGRGIMRLENRRDFLDLVTLRCRSADLIRSSSVSVADAILADAQSVPIRDIPFDTGDEELLRFAREFVDYDAEIIDELTFPALVKFFKEE